MSERYNDSPDQAMDASTALLQRGAEIIALARDHSYPLFDGIWENVGFHVASTRLASVGADVPKDSMTYIGLVLAAVEHVHAQELLEGALEVPGD